MVSSTDRQTACVRRDGRRVPPRLPGVAEPALVLEEEAADMFLNWVYRTISNIPFTYLDPLGVPGTWNGFRNQSWGTYGSNTYTGSDSTYPGDARLEWMQIVIQNIFDEKGW